MKETKYIKPVQSPCLIAYKDRLTGYMNLRPYIDMNKKSQIWGIAISSMVFKLTNENDCNWNDAANFQVNDKSRAHMPTTTNLDAALYYKDEFNSTVEKLNKCGVKADFWLDGWYWSFEEIGDDGVVVDIAVGNIDVKDKTQCCHLRLVSNYLNPQPHISIGSALLYMDDGKFSWKMELDTKRLDKVWGMNISGVFVHITEEKEKCTWYEAQKTAQNLSDKNVCISLPKAEICEFMEKHADSINDKLAILSAYGLETDFVVSDLDKHLYLTSTTNNFDANYFVAYEHRIVHKNSKCFCRFVGENVKDEVS